MSNRMMKLEKFDESDGDSDDAEYQDLLSCDKAYHDVNCDTWGMGIVCIVKDLADIMNGEGSLARWLRFVFSFVVLIGNVFCQFGLLEWTWKFIVQPAVANIQRDYAAFHRNVYDASGSKIDGAWGALDPDTKTNLCGAALTGPLFLWTILLLWTLRMLTEFRETFRMRRHLDETAHLPAGMSASLMVHETDDDHHEIIALNTPTRVALYVLVIIPKFCVCLGLLWLGCRWLTATESFADLILNAMALEFIINIDEIFFASVFPESAVEELSVVKWSHRKVEATEKEIERHQVKTYLRSLVFIFMAVAWATLYTLYLQQVIPGYANAESPSVLCHDVEKGGSDLVCDTNFIKTIQGTINSECFPYGQPISTTTTVK